MCVTSVVVTLGIALACQASLDISNTTMEQTADFREPLLEEWQRPNRCGLNVTYLLLRNKGIEVTYEEVAQCFSDTNREASLSEIQEVCRQFGLETQIAYMSFDTVRKQALPVIIHQEMESGSGHFSLLLSDRNANDEFAAIDGSRCLLLHRGEHYFSYTMTGYVLIPQTSSENSVVRFVAYSILGVVSCAFGWIVGWRVTRAPRHSAVIVVALLAVITIPGCKRQDSSASRVQTNLLDVATGAASENDLGVLGPGELSELAVRVMPYWEYRRLSQIIHALRVWGSIATFSEECPFPAPPEAGAFDSKAMLEFILDEERFVEEVGDGPSVFALSRYGIVANMSTVRPDRAVAHVDDILAVFAELTLPLETRIRVDGQSKSIQALLDDSIARFNLGNELEFTAVAYSIYLRDQGFWTNRFGETYDFDDVASVLLERGARRQGSCYGVHVHYALAHLLAAADTTRMLNDNTVSNIRDFLQAESRRLEVQSLREGLWIPQGHTLIGRSSRIEALRYSGHNLEWIAIAPKDCRPSQEVVSCVTRGVYAEVMRMPMGDLSIGKAYSVVSHCVRAIALLHGYGPIEFAKEFSNPSSSRKSR